jgi:8-oxo-dGTP pyrophosphatase MutT (NUDIX family)
MYYPPESHIHVLARGLLTCGDDIILCQLKGEDWYFLPGGHVEDGESARASLKRELGEEIGGEGYVVGDILGVCENLFSRGENAFQHEINLVFQVEVPPDAVVALKEDHLQFHRVTKEAFADTKVLPQVLKEGIGQWLQDSKVFMIEL